MKDTKIVFPGSGEDLPPGGETMPENDRMKEILELISDPQKAVGDINRLVAGELAVVTNLMSQLSQTDGYKLKFFSERIKALRELSKTLAESEAISKRDILNFDGPKFQYVFQELIASFKKAMKEAGIQETSANEVLRNFRDIMAMKEVELRKQTEKVESTFVKK